MNPFEFFLYFRRHYDVILSFLDNDPFFFCFLRAKQKVNLSTLSCLNMKISKASSNINDVDREEEESMQSGHKNSFCNLYKRSAPPKIPQFLMPSDSTNIARVSYHLLLYYKSDSG